MQNLWKLATSIIAIVLIIAQLTLLRGTINLITLALVGIVMLPWIWTGIETFKIANVVDIKTRSLQLAIKVQENKLTQQDRQLEQQKMQVEILKLIVLHLLSEREQNIMKKLSSIDPFVVENAAVPNIYAAQFRDLLDRGFIERITPQTSFAVLIEHIERRQRIDVRKHVKIAEAGIKYLELLEQLPNLDILNSP